MKTGSSEVIRPQDDDATALLRARAFVEPLLSGRVLDTGESVLAHAEGVADILHTVGAAPSLQAAAYLVYAGDHVQRADEMVANAFGPGYASLVASTRRLVQIQRTAQRGAPQPAAARRVERTERIRRMLLAFSADLRVVLLRLASRLQTLRYHAIAKRRCPAETAAEALDVYAPLASRLGIWQLKWELEDLAFRFLEPEVYKRVAALLDETRIEREQRIEAFRAELRQLLVGLQDPVEVQGRPKHIYSIARKMQMKGLDFDRVLDVRAVRVIVPTVADCYAALSRVHAHYAPIVGEYDDYVARPKANGYQSLHTVVRDGDDRAIEVQIRTRAMHERAEHGVAAHWAYKEAGVKGYAGVLADGNFDVQMAEARKAVLRELLAWGRESTGTTVASGGDTIDRPPDEPAAAVFADHIYVFTPQAAVVELPKGATPIDFAYAVHTSLGHRCRGAKVDGVLVPLNTALASGQTVEITVVREGGPSMDWLNAELGYLASPRSRAKVRAWFNVLAAAETIARGRAAVDKLLQRLGKTAVKLDDLAARLGFKRADALFEVVGKDEFSLRNIENLLRPSDAAADDVAAPDVRRPSNRDAGADGGVLVVGVESLLTSLGRCCRPAPPDSIAGYVTRGKGVAVHRSSCKNFQELRQRAPERVIAVAWGTPRQRKPALYPVNVAVEAADRAGLLRDVSEIFAKEGLNVTGAKTQSLRDARGDTAYMTMTVEVADASRLALVLGKVEKVAGVRSARRR